MSYSLTQQITECYRRAEDYRRLYEQSSNLEERERCFLATVQLTRLAEHMRAQLRGKERKEFEPKTSRRK
jgi:hypothetical protein